MIRLSLKTKEHIQKIYEHPKLYERIFKAALNHGRKAAIQALPQQHPLRILEIGIGSGLSLPYYPEGVEVTGIDPSAEMLSLARERLPLTRAQTTLLQMDGARLRFPNNTFDVTILLYVLSVAPDPLSLLREAQRVLRPGGLAIIANHFQGGVPLIRRLTFLTQHIGYHTKMRLSDITALPDWSIVRNHHVGLSRLLVLRKE